MSVCLSLCQPRLLSHCYKNDLGPHCYNDLELHSCSVTMGNIDNFDIIVAIVVYLVSLLTSSPVMWRKEHL
jgi:hypothetical protein